MAILPLTEVVPLVQDKLLACGCNHANARATAHSIYLAERDGSSSHGLFRLPGYIASIKSGKINPIANPIISNDVGSVIRVNAQSGMAPLANEVGIEALIDRCRQQGIALLAVNNSYHYSALWIEVDMLAQAGLIGMCFTAHTPMVAPFGGNQPLFSTNPMAFAWPREDGEPMIFDQATAAMSRGDIQLAALNGESLPDGIGLDANGHPTNDPEQILAGAQLPFGGYKGSNIALMIELLVGPLINDFTSVEAEEFDNGDGGPARGGEIVIAIDPNHTSAGANWAAHAERFFERYLSQKGVMLPGDRRRMRRQQVEEYGLVIADNIMSQINAM